MILGLIPARGGSRGIPGKNLADLGGRPLVAHTLAAAAAARRLSPVAVTTDDDRIAREAQAWNARVIRRPRALATSHTPMIDTVLHAIDVLAEEGLHPDAVALLQPTSPFRSAHHIDEAVARFLRGTAASLVSVHPVSEHPCECVRATRGGLRPAVLPPRGTTRRQQLPAFFYVNGAIYITRTEMLRRSRLFWDRRSLLYPMALVDGLDIDRPDQLTLARALLGARSEPAAECAGGAG